MSSSRRPHSVHWLFLYLLRRMEDVLASKDLIDDPRFDSWLRLHHVMFIVADELRRDSGLDFGLQTILHLEEVKEITRGPTIVNIVQQCKENGWISIRQNDPKLYILTAAGLAEVEKGLRENRSIATLGCSQPVAVNSLLPAVEKLVNRWAVEKMAELPGFYRNVVLRHALTSQIPVAHYAIHASKQTSYFQGGAERG